MQNFKYIPVVNYSIRRPIVPIKFHAQFLNPKQKVRIRHRKYVSLRHRSSAHMRGGAKHCTNEMFGGPWRCLIIIFFSGGSTPPKILRRGCEKIALCGHRMDDVNNHNVRKTYFVARTQVHLPTKSWSIIFQNGR